MISIWANSAAYEAGQQVGQILGYVLVIGVVALFILSLIKTIISPKKKVWVSLLILSSLLLLVGLGSAGYAVFKGIKDAREVSADDLKQGSDKVKEVRTDDDLLVFRIPKIWKPLDQLHADASLRQGHLRDEQYMLVLSEKKSDFDDSTTVRDYADLCIKNTISVASKYEEGEWRESTVAGEKMLRVEVDAVVDHLKIRYLLGYYETDGHFHQITLWTMPSRWKESGPIFEAVLDNVEPVSGSD